MTPDAQTSLRCGRDAANAEEAAPVRRFEDARAIDLHELLGAVLPTAAAPAAGLGSREDLLAAYRAAGGADITLDELRWEERAVRSVANLTRQDGREFLALAPKVPVRTEVEVFPLDQANEALERLRSGGLEGSAVLSI